MYKCEICGREVNKKITLGGYILCSKHMHQYHQYGKFLDNIQRTNNDLNDYEIHQDGSVEFFLYNQKNVRVGSFFVNFSDIEKVKYHKWRFSHSHVVTGLPAKGTQRDITHVLLDLTKEDLKTIVVDHIDGNPCNNRRENLRICTQGENVCNKSFMSNNTSNFIGVSYRADRDRYDPEIRYNGVRCHLGYRQDKREAVYARYIAEQLVFKDFANQEEQNKKYEFSKDLSDDKKKEIEDTTKSKLQAKEFWP